MGEHKRRAAEIAQLKQQPEVPDRIAGFSAGLQVASGAMRLVLSRKASIGIINEVTAKAIFEDVGKEIDSAIDRAFEQKSLPNETPA